MLQDEEVRVYNRRHGCYHHCKDSGLHCMSLCVNMSSPRGVKMETGQPRRGLQGIYSTKHDAGWPGQNNDRKMTTPPRQKRLCFLAKKWSDFALSR